MKTLLTTLFVFVLFTACNETPTEPIKTIDISGGWYNVQNIDGEPFVDMIIQQNGKDITGKAEITTKEHWVAPEIFLTVGTNIYPNIIIHYNKRQGYSDHQEIIFTGMWINESRIEGTIKVGGEVTEISFIR